MTTTATDEVIEYETLQFHTGGFLDGKPTEDVIHLVRRTAHGTPGPTLCGRARFENHASLQQHVRVKYGGEGWSVGGGISGPMYDFKRCEGCVAAADHSLPIRGRTFGPLFGAEVAP